MDRLEKIKKGFNSISSSYVFLSKFLFGNYLLKAQTVFLNDFKNIPAILIAGGGNGELLLNMLKQNCFTKCVYVDISEKMILNTKNKVEKQYPNRLNDIEFFCCPIEKFQTSEKFDIIFFPFLLDCLKESTGAEVVLQNKNRLTKTGVIVLSEFNTPPRNPWWVCVYAKCLMFVLYCFFNITCNIGLWELPDFRKIFELQGLHLKKENFLMKKILVTQIYALQ